MDWLKYANKGAVRNQPLNSDLTKAMSFLNDMGVTMEVFSGGQPSKGLARVGSHRHDDGGSADAYFYKDGRKLDWSNESDLPLYQEIVSKARQNGITGIGAGQGYMGQGSMHVGFGPEAVWGKGGMGKNAPDWLKTAFYNSSPSQAPAAKGVTLNSSPQMMARGRPDGESMPLMSPPRGVASYPIAEAPPPAGGVAPQTAAATPDARSPFGVFKDDGFAAGMKALGAGLGGTGKESSMAGIMGAFGGGSKAPDAQAQAHAVPIQSTLPAMEAADAGRAQAAQQLMAALMSAKAQKRTGGGGLGSPRGFNMMG